eukprot:s2707_g3.t1
MTRYSCAELVLGKGVAARVMRMLELLSGDVERLSRWPLPAAPGGGHGGATALRRGVTSGGRSVEMRRTERTHQLRDDGKTDARATEVFTFRRDVLKRAGLSSFQTDVHSEQPRASTESPRKRESGLDGEADAPWSSRSANTPKERKNAGVQGFHVPADLPELSGPLGCAPSLAPSHGHDGHMTETATRTETSMQLKSQSSNLSKTSNASAPAEDSAPFEPFEVIPEQFPEEEGPQMEKQRKPQSITVNSLASSRAKDFSLETSESLGFQHQLAWLYISSAGDSAPSKQHAASVNSLASSEALTLGDPGRFRRTETLLLSNERRQREAEAAFLSELRIEQQGKHSNTIESLLSSWPESLSTPPNQDSAPGSSAASRQLSPQVGESPEPLDSRPSSRGSNQAREGRGPVPSLRPVKKTPALSMVSLGNIQEELDDDGSISFLHEKGEKSAKGEKNGERRSQRNMGSVSPKAYETESNHISSFG